MLLSLERSGVALHEQLERALRDAVREGRVQAGTRLPSSRALATELGISRGVVTAAYDQLVAEGYLQTRQGAPVRVAEGVRAHAPRSPAPPLIERFAYDLTPGLPDLVGFPRERWLRSVRSAWREAPLDAVGYGDPRGEPALREALADYLGRARGAAAEAEHMVICTGFRQGLSLTCRWLREAGIERVALEDPGWHAQRLIVEQAGLEVAPVTVDREGIVVGELGASGAEVVVITPAHQFPTGAVLSAARRAELIEWAERGDHLIIEDDYDAELCLAQVGALQGLAPDRVLYIGSASKRLTPGMRLGWMLPPSWMSWALITAKAIEDAGSEISGQLALADFITRGELERHLRRMRSRYARRRELLTNSLAQHQPSWQPGSDPDGMFLLVELPDNVDEASLLTASARAGIGLEGLSLHSYLGTTPPGLVIGCGSLPEPAIDRAIKLLTNAPTARHQQTHPGLSSSPRQHRPPNLSSLPLLTRHDPTGSAGAPAEPPSQLAAQRKVETAQTMAPARDQR
jgi:GntR family transcriptional regulator/MocR family aminotransferase